MRRLFLVAAAVIFLAACAVEPPSPGGPDERVRVVATTAIIGDVTARVGGDLIDLTVLIGAGVDPHSFVPSAGDLAQLDTADVIFVNGLDFEQSLLPALDSIESEARVVAVSDGAPLIDSDPHVWQDPANVMIWADNIASALADLDPAHAEDYAANAAAYQSELTELDDYLMEQTARIPEADRRLVTNHDTLAYFARRYGFEVIGTVYIGASEVSEPSAGAMAELVETVRAEHVPAIFVETTVSDQLARTLVEEIGYEVQVLTLYTDSLGPSGSGADSYIGMMRANIQIIVSGLGGGGS